ncbi:MAG: hypothetical protein PHW73_13485, partial [Atribacterota bacterium]|nr:hypothetical protein [Atribacterota bacterium]
MVAFTSGVSNSKRSIPSGEYEGGILCQDCDNKILGNLETYGSQVLFGGNIKGIATKNFKKPDGLEFMQISGLDYKKFKLFLLSLLWKSHISSRPFFKRVDLGSYGEKIRHMILTGNPGKVGDFPCIVTSYRKSTLPKEIIAEPRKIKLDHFFNYSYGYPFLIDGFLYIFKIIENDQTDWILEAAINENGEMKVI